MTVREHFSIRTLMAAVIFSLGCGTGADERPALAYSHEGVLYLMSESGTLIRQVHARLPIVDFAISPNFRQVVFGSFDRRKHGGELYLLDIPTGNLDRFTDGPYWIGLDPQMPLEEGEGEVYAEPDFSPDGQRVVFAFRGQAEGDAVEADGPLGVIDLRTREVIVLESTLYSEEIGPSYAHHPRWSPDARQILLNSMVTAALTDSEGRALADISFKDSEGADAALGWVGPRCVAYTTGKDPMLAWKGPVHLANMETGECGLARDVGLPELRTGTVGFSGRLVVRWDDQTRLWVESIGDHFEKWQLPGDVRTTSVRILDRVWEQDELPALCK